MKTIVVAYSFGQNKQFGYSGIDRYSELLDKGLDAIGYKHDKYEYGKSGNALTRIFATPKAVRGYDVIHLTQPHGYEAFLTKADKKILTWHDNMIFTRKGSRQLINWIRGFMAYNLADIITFGSNQSFNELKSFMQQHHSWKEDKVYSVIPMPIDDMWIKAKPQTDNSKRKGFIYIGAIDYPHKNFKGLMDTYQQICVGIKSQQKPPLHIFTSTANAQEILSSYDNYETEEFKLLRGYEPAFNSERYLPHSLPVILHERTTDEEILPYLRNAIAMLHLSLEEGYGLPILESIAVGTPVITLDSAKIPEEVAKLTIRTSEPEAEALKLYDKPKSATAEQIKYAKSLNKENYAKQMVELYG